MARNRILFLVIAALALGLSACNLMVSEVSPEPGQPTETAQPVPTKEAPPTVIVPAETPGSFSSPEEVCLTAGEGETQYINQAGGYCLLIPEGFEVTQDFGLDIFVVGPTLAVYGQEGLVLAFDFSLVGAPGGAGD